MKLADEVLNELRKAGVVESCPSDSAPGSLRKIPSAAFADATETVAERHGYKDNSFVEDVWRWARPDFELHYRLTEG